MNLHDAEQAATHVLSLLDLVCRRQAIAGSIRRRKPVVKDIELVVMPTWTRVRDLFGNDTIERHSNLDSYLPTVIRRGDLAYDTETPRNGERYKRLRLPGADVAIDLFVADTTNWGNILAIRTGNADFSRLLVTSRVFGGLMPTDMRQRDGALWRRDELIPCDTEEEFFAALGIDTVPLPERRDAEMARHLAQMAVR
jgi:DNA polymerase/3'-5' exonuclease PolX